MHRSFAYLTSVALAVAVSGPLSAQSLEDVLAVTEAQSAVEPTPADTSVTAPNPPLVQAPDRAPLPRGFEEMTQFDITLFEDTTGEDAPDRLLQALKLLAYLEHQMAASPDTPMGLSGGFPGAIDHGDDPAPSTRQAAE